MFAVRVDSSDSQLGLSGRTEGWHWETPTFPLMSSFSFPHFLFSIHGHNAEDSYNLGCVQRDKAFTRHRSSAISLAFQAVLITQPWTLLIHHSFIHLSIHVFIHPSIHSSNSYVCLQKPPPPPSLVASIFSMNIHQGTSEGYISPACGQPLQAPHHF